jgi:hypothetical protein
MEQNRNPIYTKGDRNVFCPYYSDCLDHAVKNHWEYWACLDCEYKPNERLVTDILISSASADLYYSLSPAFFKKERNFPL